MKKQGGRLVLKIMIKRGPEVVTTIENVVAAALKAKAKHRDILKEFHSKYNEPKRKRLIFDKANKPIGVEDY